MASLKSLKLKRVFAWTIYNNLTNVPPKEYPTTEEIKATLNDILPEFEQHVGEYVKMNAEAKEVADQASAKKISESELRAKVDEINEKFREYSKKEGMEIIELKLNKDTLDILTKQFNREKWGTSWMVNIKEFAELDKAFADANK